MKILRLIVFFAILFILFRFVFVFRKLECRLDGATLESGVCERLEQRFRNRSLFFTDLENDQIWDELLADQQYSQAYQYQKISKSLFGQVQLLLLAKLPDYRLIVGQEKYLLNQNNKLRNNQDNLLMTSINFLADELIIDRGYLQEAKHQKFLSLSQALSNYQIVTNKIIWLSDQEIQLFLNLPSTNNELVVIIDGEQDFVYQMQRLSLVLTQNDLSAIIADKKNLDMRFNLPVLQ